MQKIRRFDPVTDIALEHQAEMLRLAAAAEPQAPLHTRWRLRLAVFVGLAVPVAFLLVRMW